MRCHMGDEVPEVIAIYRSQRVYPMPNNKSVNTDVWCVFFKVDDKLTYWLMDNKYENLDCELDAWRRFVTEWNNPAHELYKQSVVRERNTEDADLKWAVFNPT